MICVSPILTENTKIFEVVFLLKFVIIHMFMKVVGDYITVTNEVHINCPFHIEKNIIDSLSFGNIIQCLIHFMFN